MNRRILLFPLLLIILLAADTRQSVSAEPAATVKAIRHWSNPNYTRIVINLDRTAKYNHKLLEKDPSINVQTRRLLIDIPNSKLDPKLAAPIPINDGLLKVVRTGQYTKDDVRIVLDIESIGDFKIFPLNNPYRIVVDVSGEKKENTAPAKHADEKTKAPEKEAKEPAKEAQIAAAPAVISKPTITQQLGLKVKTIVIDPGHGGKDPGAIGKGGLKEKDVTLKLARMLKKRLAKDLNSKIVLTRDKDVFVDLEERTAIANSQDADLFVSIHINASPKRKASGLETYILNFSVDEEAKRVAARENATSTRSVSDLEFILNDLIKTAKTNDSSRLAAAVHGTLVKTVKLKYKDTRSNGVKGAPFYVLVGTKMPSILVEVSFISNPDEEKRLKDENYLKTVVEGIAAGLLEYMDGARTI